MCQSCVRYPVSLLERRKAIRCDVKTPESCRDVPGQICQLKPIRSSVFFWLCENCCSTMTLSIDRHTGLAIVPISSAQRQGNMSGMTEPQELCA
jgi:hypothetical protein